MPVKPSRARRFERPLQQIVAEHLRSLRQHQFLARQRGADRARASVPRVTCFTVSTAGTADDRRARCGRLVEHLVDGLQVDERAHRVVHRHQVGIRPSEPQRVLHRFLPAVAALHHAHAACAGISLRQHLRDPLEILGAHRDHDLASPGRDAANLRTVWIRIGEPSSSMNCLRLVPAFSGGAFPMRVPRPAAGSITATFM